jgi:hypothetical protein
VSLLPSATESLALIGGLKLLVGRSHECDYPASAADIPILTASRLTFESSSQIDSDVSKVGRHMQTALSHKNNVHLPFTAFDRLLHVTLFSFFLHLMDATMA